ncbi:hypothetical protein IY145_08310 [Methylosinus sp. H3A]|uniref:hypothetical protein n=1 Tax=Methylosinus sp. H3A TaxID=2785786 RepID=UPI0018C2987B|nr:hypothetical protein [Methylosinus sp. H3A]MBG0809380.1 hypothetical protein [Methylosinus sp. H3A]
MKLDFSAFRLPTSLRAKTLTLILGLALGVAALSLGGCTCMDADGNSVACPDAY